MSALVNKERTVPLQRSGGRDQLARTPRESVQQDDRWAIADKVGHGNRDPLPLNELCLVAQ